jgi:hypothetical protein
MATLKMGLRGVLLGGSLVLASSACSSDDASETDGGGAISDADPNAPDADPNAPDADPNAPDADPSAPDASPGDPDASMLTGCSADALELITLVNEYRAENALPAIAASPSLCFVGDTHIGDLVANAPHAPANCNLHSWSDQGSWSACCYTSDHAQAQCMWDKPKELTVYPSNGYENSAGGGGSITPTQALNLWKGSAGHNAVILNEGIWANQTWRAMGAGVQNGYAMLWFGTSIDPAN